MRKPYALLAGILVLVLWGWKASTMSPLLLPSPIEVGEAFKDNAGTIALASFWTGVAALCGLGIALLVATGLALLFLRYRWFESALYPYAVVLQTLPVIAIAPLLMIWFGYGLGGSIASAAIVCFFPLLTSLHLGLSLAPRELRDLFRLMKASERDTLIKLRLPNAVPYFFSGLRTAVGLSVIGAIVGEFVCTYGEATNLGRSIMISLNGAETPNAFAFIAASGLLSYGLFQTVLFLEKRTLQRMKRGGT